MYNLQKTFHKYKDYPIAIYGLGTETERVLNEIDSGFHIIGLLDGFRKDGIIYGKPIISLPYAIAKQVKLIIVVARPGSCRAIIKRIGKICKENQIAVFDIRGKDLCAQNRTACNLNHVEGYTKKQLREMASQCEIISFDLFDTLIMRQVLLSTDVIELTEYRLRERGIFLKDFCKKRQQAEKELSKDTAPNLKDIYQWVLDSYDTDQITAEELADIEWQTEYNLIVPRQEMAELLSEFSRQGKKIYIVTDTYYIQEQIISLLEKCGIRTYTDILISCEYKIGKTQGLFKILTDKIGEQECLHIGDDLVSDIESAAKWGLSFFQIYSSLELLEMVGYFGMEDRLEYFSARVKAGLFVAGVFNSPFQFEKETKELAVRNIHDLGYLFMAPVISDFAVWFDRKIREKNISNIWLGTRDGYLIKKLYDMICPNNNAICFLTSRMAAIRAAVADMDDIAYVDSMKFRGSVQKQLKERFGIIVDGEREGEKTLGDYSDIILKMRVVISGIIKLI